MILHGLESLKVTSLLSLLPYQFINPASNHPDSNSKLKLSICISKITRKPPVVVTFDPYRLVIVTRIE